VRLADMSEADIRAYVIADNKLAENASWNRELLGLELQYLFELDVHANHPPTPFPIKGREADTQPCKGSLLDAKRPHQGVTIARDFTPDIIEKILIGTQPVDLTVEKLRRLGALPHAWDQQRAILGFTD
jgi:hypothetical protein